MPVAVRQTERRTDVRIDAISGGRPPRVTCGVGRAAGSVTAPATISILLIDDHPVVITGLVALMRGSRAHVVADATSIDRGAALAREYAPDVVLLDVRLDRQTLRASDISTLRTAAPEAKIILFTAFPEHPAVGAAIEAGAVGYLLKDTRPTDLVEGVIAAAEGRPLPVRVRRGSEVALTAREYEILVRVAVGGTNTEIARQLFLAPNTVKTYWQNALCKLGARNRADAIYRACLAGII